MKTELNWTEPSRLKRSCFCINYWYYISPPLTSLGTDLSKICSSPVSRPYERRLWCIQRSSIHVPLGVSVWSAIYDLPILLHQKLDVLLYYTHRYYIALYLCNILYTISSGHTYPIHHIEQKDTDFITTNGVDSGDTSFLDLRSNTTSRTQVQAYSSCGV